MSLGCLLYLLMESVRSFHIRHPPKNRFNSEWFEKFSHGVRIMIGSFGGSCKKLERRIWKEKVSVVLWHGIKKADLYPRCSSKKNSLEPHYSFSVALHVISLPVSPFLLLPASLSLQSGWGESPWVRAKPPGSLSNSHTFWKLFLWTFPSFGAFCRPSECRSALFFHRITFLCIPVAVKSWSVIWKWSHQDCFKRQKFRGRREIEFVPWGLSDIHRN